MGEELAPPGSGLLPREMEVAPAREKSKVARAGSCRPWCAAGRPGTDRLEEEEEEEEEMGRGQSGPGI